VLTSQFYFDKIPQGGRANKESRAQGRALKPYAKTKREIPKQVRDDTKEKNQARMSAFIPVQ
jgi:hypothetical protein